METEWAITAAVVPAALSAGGLVMVLAARECRIAARLCFALAGVWLGVVSLMWLIHTPSSLLARVAAGLGIGAFVFVLIPFLIRIAWPPDDARAQNQSPAPPSATGQPPIVNQGPASAYSYGQQGGITAGTVNIGPAKRTLSDPRSEPLKQQFLAELPRNKPITVMAVLGNGESIDFAEEIHAFLKQNGFTMKESDGISQGIFTGSPKGVGVEAEANGELTVIVGVAQ